MAGSMVVELLSLWGSLLRFLVALLLLGGILKRNRKDIYHNQTKDGRVQDKGSGILTHRLPKLTGQT